MNFLLEGYNWVLLLSAIVSGGLLFWPMISKGAGGAVSPTEAVQLINRSKAVLIDVGEPAEFAALHATGARNVPFGQIEGAKELPSNKSLPIVVLCPSGARAGRAAGLLRKAGYEQAVALAGGTAAWREAQLPVDKKA